MDQRENTTDGTMAITAYWNGDYEMIHNHVTHKILFYNNIIIYYIKLRFQCRYILKDRLEIIGLNPSRQPV